MNLQVTPRFTTEEEYRRIVAGDATRIVSVTRFGDEAARSVTTEFMESKIAAPAIWPRSIEVTLAPPTAVVDRTSSRALFGSVETASWGGGAMLVRLTLAGEPSDALRLGYHYLFRLQREEDLVAIRYVNYAPDLKVLRTARFMAWLDDGPVDDEERIRYGAVGRRGWRPVAPATTDVRVKHGPPVIEGWFVPSHSCSVRYLPRWQLDMRTADEGLPPIAGYRTYVDLPESSGVIISTGARSSVDSPNETLIQQVVTACNTIRHLLSAESLTQERIVDGFALSDLLGIRVFLSDAEHGRRVLEEVERQLGEVPMLCIHSEHGQGLLVQIDGQAWKAK